MASYDEPEEPVTDTIDLADEPDDEESDFELCVVCGAVVNVGLPLRDVWDQPSCGRMRCDEEIRATQDYHDERG